MFSRSYIGSAMLKGPLRAVEFFRCRDGSITVEFVVVVPLLIGALMFSFEFGRALWAYDVMTRDVRAGIRYLSRAPSSYTGQAGCLAMTGLPEGDPPSCNENAKRFPWTNVSADPFSYSSSPFTTADFNQNGSVITMTANVPLTLGFLGFIGAGTSYTLSVTDRIRHIGN
jgi:Flp pilus assembly protein TadG